MGSCFTKRKCKHKQSGYLFIGNSRNNYCLNCNKIYKKKTKKKKITFLEEPENTDIEFDSFI